MIENEIGHAQVKTGMGKDGAPNTPGPLPNKEKTSADPEHRNYPYQGWYGFKNPACWTVKNPKMGKMGQCEGGTIYFRCPFAAQFRFKALMDKSPVHKFLTNRTKDHAYNCKNDEVDKAYLGHIRGKSSAVGI